MSGGGGDGGSSMGAAVAVGLGTAIVVLLAFNAGRNSSMAPSTGSLAGNGGFVQSNVGGGSAGRRPANTESGWKSCLAANNLLNVCKPDGGQVICKTAELAQQAGRLCGS